MRKSAAIDEFELDQLLQNLPTSVDDFQKKELSLKQQKSPFISQRSSPLTQNEGYIIDILGQDISSSNSSTHSIAKSPSFEMELDANDLEVLRSIYIIGKYILRYYCKDQSLKLS